MNRNCLIQYAFLGVDKVNFEFSKAFDALIVRQHRHLEDNDLLLPIACKWQASSDQRCLNLSVAKASSNSTSLLQHIRTALLQSIYNSLPFTLASKPAESRLRGFLLSDRGYKLVRTATPYTGGVGPALRKTALAALEMYRSTETRNSRGSSEEVE